MFDFNGAAKGKLRSGEEQLASGMAAINEMERQAKEDRRWLEAKQASAEKENELLRATVRMCMRVDCPQYLIDAILEYHKSLKQLAK